MVADDPRIAWYRQRAGEHGQRICYLLSPYGSIRPTEDMVYLRAREAAHYANFVLGSNGAETETPGASDGVSAPSDAAVPVWSRAGEKSGQLFKLGDFRLHSGHQSPWKIDCDALSDADLMTLADWARRELPPFGSVEGVPRGGLRFAAALQKFITPGEHPLIVDDVLTTGASMEAQRKGREATGLVIFARDAPPMWVQYLFRTSEHR
jgi:hypothetical protein